MAKKRDWQSLTRKIRDGRTIEEAARLSGIPLAEAEKYLKDQFDKGFVGDDFVAWRLAHDAMVTGVATLQNAAVNPNHVREEFDSETGKRVAVVRPTEAHIRSAEALLKFSIDLRRTLDRLSNSSRLGSRQAPNSAQKDLFDSPPAQVWGCWDFSNAPDS